ncbi:hypothetical protein BO94DRAFT_284563 [Aspergillus sclerotioniger CBS 115572]|uniref:Uncharacterized protein n=1 Tax=Aspergillus sclerotioniger CBS 115572 TaxID=1450535 RepID=A0A317X8D0_9EURO|nr:hypothetical protein BO94DRAFT_284563 [Aspergillus sclerotioniger CBS 115572]PWY94789.1 hypothetical protein BO94DRAFT_284563 [Aspergillus sclerotioniger CBS 115572]
MQGSMSFNLPSEIDSLSQRPPRSVSRKPSPGAAPPSVTSPAESPVNSAFTQPPRSMVHGGNHSHVSENNPSEALDLATMEIDRSALRFCRGMENFVPFSVGCDVSASGALHRICQPFSTARSRTPSEFPNWGRSRHPAFGFLAETNPMNPHRGCGSAPSNLDPEHYCSSEPTPPHRYQSPILISVSP